jgi:hypothetical protein
MLKTIRILSLLATTLLAATSGFASDPPPQNGGIQSLKLQPAFENADGTETPRQLLPSDPQLVFSLVGGSIGYLSSSGTSVADLPGHFSGFEVYDIDVNGWMATAWKRSAPAQKQLPKGVTVTPADTRVGHVVAIAYARGGRLGLRFLGRQQGMSIRVKGARGNSELTFFDRPCRTSGVIATPQGEVSMELEIPAPGFYLLKIVRTPDSRLRLVAEEAATAIERDLVITLA